MSMHYDSALVDRGRSPRLFALLVLMINFKKNFLTKNLMYKLTLKIK